MSKTIIINSLILSIGIFIGRLSGYIRELIIAYKYQATETADNIILLLTVPDLLNNLLASGAVAGIIIPLLAKEKNFDLLLSGFLKKLFILSIWLYLFVFTIIFFIYDFNLFFILAVSLLAIFPNMLTFVASTYLQYEKRFKIISLNTLIFNVVIIAFLLLDSKYFIFAVGIIIASIIRMFWTIYDLKHTDIKIKSFFVKTNKNVISYKTLLFVILANGLMFINPVIDKIFASFMNVGSVAMLSYAEKIYMLPVSIFLTTYAVAMFPDLAKMVANKKYIEVKVLLNKSIIINLIFSVLIVIFIFIFSLEITSLIYKVTNLSQEILLNISNVLNGYLVSLLFAGTNAILLKIIFSYKRYNILMIYSVIMLLGNVVLDYLVISLDLELMYIAYGTSLMSVLSVIFLYFYSKNILSTSYGN